MGLLKIPDLMDRLTTIALTVGLSVLLSGCPAKLRPLNQPALIFAEGAYVHEQSGMTLPLMVGDYRRGAIQRYDQDGLDVSAGYDLVDGERKISATVYLYPAPPLLSINSPMETAQTAQALLASKEFEARKEEVMKTHPGGKLLEDAEMTIPMSGNPRTGRIATFEYEHTLAGQRQPVKSHLCLFNFIGGKWALKYRITYPRNMEATREIDMLLQGVPWNVPRD